MNEEKLSSILQDLKHKYPFGIIDNSEMVRILEAILDCDEKKCLCAQCVAKQLNLVRHG